MDKRVIDRVAKFRDVGEYSFIVEYPPPLVRPALTEMDVLHRPGVELYIHIPDCPYICDFCSFYKVKQMSDEMRDKYLSAVEKELDFYLAKTDLKSRKVASVFFGGGTPTRLTPAEFSGIVGVLRDKLNLADGVEITAESTPDTLTDGILAAMREAGVNRLSIGVQDFNDEVLEARKRGHTGMQAVEAFERARSHGFDSINIDLMYRLPLQTLANWEKNLEIIGRLRPEYVTLYHLRKEKRTLLGKQDESKFPTKEEAMEMYLRSLEFLVGAGYAQIAPNQFAKPGKTFVQQERKWHEDSELLGLGVSSYSWFNGRSYRNIGRFGTPHGVNEYIEAIEAGKLPIESGEKITPLEHMCHFAVFGIKTSGVNRPDGGIDKQLFLQKFGVPIEMVFSEVLEKLKKEELVTETAARIQLTIGGLIVAEEVATMFYSKSVQERLEQVGNKFGREGL